MCCQRCPSLRTPLEAHAGGRCHHVQIAICSFANRNLFYNLKTGDIQLVIRKIGHFLARLDDMVEQAFDDQCTGANPRYPLMSEIRQMYLNAYYGN